MASKDFTQGVVCAAAYLSRERNEPTLAADMLAGFGYRWKDVVESGADEYDLSALRGEMGGGQRWIS